MRVEIENSRGKSPLTRDCITRATSGRCLAEYTTVACSDELSFLRMKCTKTEMHTLVTMCIHKHTFRDVPKGDRNNFARRVWYTVFDACKKMAKRNNNFSLNKSFCNEIYYLFARANRVKRDTKRIERTKNKELFFCFSCV